MEKNTLLIWSDFLIPTGFGIVAENLFSDLHKDYNVKIIGINNRGDKEWDTKKYFVYPTDNSSDPLGVKLLLKKAGELKPKIILLFQDHFNIKMVLPKLREASPQSKILAYFPQDCLTLTPFVLDMFDQLDGVMLYTQWSQNIIKHFTGKTYPYIYHGVNLNQFKTLDQESIYQAKKVMGWTNKFIAVNVNRFQPRKNIMSTLRAWSMFTKGYSQCLNSQCQHKQPLHLPLCELCMNQDLIKHPAKNLKEDAILYLHMEISEISMGMGIGNNLVYGAYQAGFTKKDFNTYIAINQHKIYGDNPPPPETINLIYNLADVNLSTTYGEGAGLSLIESAVVGTPSIAPKNSSIPEMLGEYGWLVKNCGIAHLPGDFNNSRPVVDEWEFVQALEDAYGIWKTEGTLKNKDLQSRAVQLFNWDKIKQKFYNWIKEKGA